MSLNIDKNIYTKLDGFFATNTISDVDRHTYIVCDLRDEINKIDIALVFLRDWDSLESDSYNQVVIENIGAVFTFPCYWISIPKKLAISYFTYIIEEFYQEEVSKWNMNSASNNSGNINGSCINNNCVPPCGIIQGR